MASAKQYAAEAFFLEVEGKDPSSKLLARFRKYTPPVKKVSEYVSRIERIDTENGIKISYNTNGIKFRIHSYKWYGNVVVINGGYYEGNLSASWADYIWMQIAGIWILIYAFPPAIQGYLVLGILVVFYHKR